MNPFEAIKDGIVFASHGGFMMVPLLLSALIALTVIFERLFALQKRYHADNALVLDAMRALGAGDVDKARKLCAGKQKPVTSIITAAIEHFGNSTEEMELSMKNQAEAWMPLLEKRIDIIDTVITAAPLMGLLGTITGMMASFRVLSEKGVNEPNAITGGVAEALIATATGLVIALLCLVAYNYLTARVKTFVYQMEGVASRLIEMRMAAERTRK